MNSDTLNYSSSVREVRRITLLGLIANLILSIFKFILGTFGNSQALVADAAHSLSDLSTDCAILFGVAIWSKPADKDHPYGHKQIETYVATGIGVALLMVSVSIAYHAVRSLGSHSHTQGPHIYAFYGALFSIIVKEFLYRRTIGVGKRHRSPAVVANAWHHRSDAFSSIPVALAVVIASKNSHFAFADHLGAFVVAIFILRASYKILRDAFKELSGQGVEQSMLVRIKDIVLNCSRVKSTHAIRTRWVGGALYVDLHIQVDPLISVQDGHEVSEFVKRALIDAEAAIVDVIVHLEPFSG